MKIRLQRDDVLNVIPPNVSYDQLTLALSNISKANDILFCQRQVGSNVLIWTLPEDGWVPLSATTEPLLSRVHQHYEECCQQIMLAGKSNVNLIKAALSVPSEDYIFFRQQGSGVFELALTAWGYKFPMPGGSEPPTGKGKPRMERQEVRLCFVYDGQRLSEHPFAINDLRRQTDANGIFEAGVHSVGTTFPIEMGDGTTFSLTVEKGKSLYEFDLTKYFVVEIIVYKGGKPLPDTLCVLSYNGGKKNITTDRNGRAESELPFSMTPANCDVTVEGQKQSKQATMPKTTLRFDLPYEQQFINIDDMTGTPIARVKNVVKITFPDDITQTTTVISDNKGLFIIKAVDDAKLDIVSTKTPNYETKHTEESLFRTAKKIIPMKPLLVTLHFRTIEAFSGNLLPQCSLRITGSETGLLKLSSSGSGEFDVTFRINERLTIVASKKGYKDNGDKVYAQTFQYLESSKERRDIPLTRPIKYEYKGSKKNVEKEYDMFQPNCTFLFKWNLCSGCTTITLLAETGKELGRFGYLACGRGVGSATITCPTKKLRVIVVDENCHDAHYIITSE